MGINKQACDVLACVPLVGAECWRRQQTRKKTPNGSGFSPWETFWSSVAMLSQHLPSV